MWDPKIRWAAAAICVIAFVVIAILSDRVFERVPHSEDEVAYLFQAKVFAHNRLSVPTPPNDQAFWSPFVIDYQGQRFGKYPPGWPLLLSLGVRLDAPWLVNAFLAVLTLILLLSLGNCIYGAPMGVWAAGLAVLTPGFLFLSSSFLSHSASLFWTTLAVWSLCRWIKNSTSARRREGSHLTSGVRESQPIFAALTGVALGFTFITRPFAALGVGLPLAAFLLLLMGRGELSWAGLRWLIPGGAAIAIMLPLYWWAISGDPAFNPYLLVWPYDRVGFGPDIGPVGYTLRDAIFTNTKLKLTALATGLFGWPGWSNLLFLPIPFITGRSGRWDWLLLAILAGLISIHTIYWAFGGVDGGFPRYYYDALPALLLLTVRGMQVLGHYLSNQGAGRLGAAPVWRKGLPYLPAAIAMALFAHSFIWQWPSLVAAQRGKYDITADPLQVMARANLSEPALVLIKDVNSWSDFAVPFVVNSPTLDGPVVYAIDWGPQVTRQVRLQFAERTCWELQGQNLSACPPNAK